MLINIDYGKNKINPVSQLIFEPEIDIKDYLCLYNGQKTKYKLCSVCTHIGKSGSSGHYIAYCLNKNNNTWYEFNDSFCYEIKDMDELKENSPYLLIYELI